MKSTIRILPVLLLSITLLASLAAPSFATSDWASNFNLPGADDSVFAVAETPDAFYYGGTFNSIGSVIASRIARVDKATGVVTPLGSGVDNVVWSLAVIGTDLYVGGEFTTAGGGTANGIAKWNITTKTWSPLLDGAINGVSYHRVSVLLANGTDLYVGGQFTTAGSVTANGVAKWNTTMSTWSALGTGLASGVSASSASCMVMTGGVLYVGGIFETAGGIAANSVAAWSGSSWSVLKSGAFDPAGVSDAGGSPAVLALAVLGGNICLGGKFGGADGILANNIVIWNTGTSTWSVVGSGVNYSFGGGNVAAFSVNAGDLYVAGAFSNAGGVVTDGIAKWNGTNWSALGAGMGYTGYSYVNALLLSGSDLYVVGSAFQRAGNVPASRIARWSVTSGTWSAPITGDGMAGDLNGTAVYKVLDAGNVVYVGGVFHSAGGVPALRVACWNKTTRTWSALGSGVGSGIIPGDSVNALAMTGSDLYVGGSFSVAGGVAANGIARWNTATNTWSALTSGISGFSVNALAVIGTDLYVGGNFTSAGGVAGTTGIAKWNGNSWSSVGNGIGGDDVRALAVNGTDLYAGGSFSSAGGNAANNIARWDGAAWSALDTGTSGHVDSLAVGGGNLYVGGFFDAAGSLTSIGSIAAWNLNTATWSRLGPGIKSFATIYALAVSGGTVYAGGDFSTAGGNPAPRAAQWDGSAWSALGNGVNNTVLSLAAIGNVVWAGGGFGNVGAGFNYIGSKPSSGIAVFAENNVATDFNGDGHPDFLLFHGSDLRTYVWYLNGPSYGGSAPGPTLPAGWSVVGVADFNGDGKPDLLLFHASDLRTYVWYPNGPSYSGSAPGPTLPAGWSVVSVADFNGDGKPDLLLFHASDLRTYVWYLNGPSYTGAAPGPTLPAGWAVVDVGDLNGDGQPDLVLFHASDRRTYVWYLNGPTYSGAAPGPTLPAGWSVAGVADFDGNGTPDLLLFHASDLRTYVWYLSGPTYTGAAPGPTLPAGWSLVAP